MMGPYEGATWLQAAGHGQVGAAVDAWHAAVRHALAGIHFPQLALEPLAAHQVMVPGHQCALKA